MLLKYKNINVFYQKEGKKKNTIFILPGWGNTRPSFQKIIEALKEDYTLYILDYPFFGESETPKEDFTILDYAEIIIQIMNKEKIENPIILAHSFGGRITALLASYYHIPIKKIVLFDVAGIKRRKNIILFLKEKIYKLLKKLAILLHHKSLEAKLLNHFSSADYRELPLSMKKTFQNIIQKDLTKYYKKIQTETLIIWGEKDKDTPLKDAYLLQNIIQDSGLIIYSHCHHFSYLEKPIETIHILREFLKKDRD